MPLVTLSEIDRRANARVAKSMTKSASAILEHVTANVRTNQRFDVFLSHSYSDARMNMNRLLGTKSFLEEFNLSVYVDWIEDRQLNREDVNADTAEHLRHRMNHSKSLLFATSETSNLSKWMPWELGYMDGAKRRVAIFPLVATAQRATYRGQEYLGVYPYIEQAKASGTNDLYLWVCETPKKYVRLDFWLDGEEPHFH